MTWAAIAVGTVAAVSSGVKTYQGNKRAKAIGNSLNDTIAYARANPGVFGEKIDFESIDYTPLFRQDAGYGNMAGDVIAGNRRNLPASQALASDTNAGITNDAVNRINTLYPGFSSAFNQQSQNTQNFLRGNIPQEDRDMISARRSEAISLGGGGATQQQVAADLGLSRVDLMNQGQAALTNNVNLLGLIDPISRHLTPQSSFVDVGQAISQAAAENQFDASFAASERDAEFNAAMLPDPQKAGIMNLEAQRAGLKAGNQQQSVLGNALVSGVTAGVGSYFGGGGGYSMPQQPQQAPAYIQSQPVQQAPAYIPSAQYFNSQANQQAGISNISGTGPYSTPYNPGTGAQFGEQGGLWSYYSQPRQSNRYAFQ